LLRLVVGVASVAGGVSFFLEPANPSASKWVLASLMTLGGTFMGIGFLTPFAGVLLALCFAGTSVLWPTFPSWSVQDSRWIAIALMVMAAAIALLGPGAYSLDGRLFGRREIVIPPVSRRREP